MNLFWETRALTSAREDHLTCFIAAALEVDGAFREAYEALVLGHLASDGRAPQIVAVQTQTSFAEHRSVPDMVLVLADGRRILCEHKIDAPETLQVTSDGQTVKQLERYLAIPGIAGVVYMRSGPTTLADDVLGHELYIRPKSGTHFLWRDLYGPLTKGQSAIARWLLAGFDRLGFTPPVPHIGELWGPVYTQEIQENQRNFGKLWQRTRAHLDGRYKIEAGSRCQLYLTPLAAGLVKAGFVSPMSQSGSLLRVRIDTNEEEIAAARHRLQAVAERLPVRPEIEVVQKPDGRIFIDLLVSMGLVLADADDAAKQEDRLYEQVAPIFDALDAD
jgi:hypothetical protein